MSRFLKIFYFTILIICLLFNKCYAIDENITNEILSTNETSSDIENITNTDTSIQNEVQSTYTNTDVEETTTSTTISSVSNVSNNSTITNILLIALIVIGFLLILLAIAILIRLKK